MTNIAEISVALILATNWTGFNFQDKELGFVTTNHLATVVYQGQTNLFTLKVDASETAVWRQYAIIHYFSPTNMSLIWTNI